MLKRYGEMVEREIGEVEEEVGELGEEAVGVMKEIEKVGLLSLLLALWVRERLGIGDANMMGDRTFERPRCLICTLSFSLLMSLEAVVRSGWLFLGICCLCCWISSKDACWSCHGSVRTSCRSRVM